MLKSQPWTVLKIGYLNSEYIKQQFQILEGSHKCGRIDHHPVLKQAEADLQRVEEVKKTCPHKFVEMNPGGWLSSR